ncbi:MAG TPA: alkaline phosphatase family protein [Chitinophagaceae bacterium]
MKSTTSSHKNESGKAAAKKAGSGKSPATRPLKKKPKAPPPQTPIQHVVIIFKENHGFDNYFGTFPGANGVANLPHLPDPPLNDPLHTHEAWLKRSTNAVKGQYHQSDIPNYFALAKQFTLCDNYYTDVAGPSTPNHLMLIAADSPVINNPHISDPKKFRPPFNIPSLPENLLKAGIEWKNYGGYIFDYITHLIGNPRNVSAGRFAIDAAAGKLPPVSWVYGAKNRSEHPTENVMDGDAWSAAQIRAIIQGGLWPSTAIFITWDDWGGWYDHVNPPEVEKWTDGTQFRYGNRVGCIVVSPYAKSGYISKALHSHISLLRCCETIFGLAAINQRDKNADNMFDCFDFSQKPLPPPKL